MATALGFVTKGIHAALGAQVRVGTGLEVVVIARRTGFVVARWARSTVAWTAVVKLAGRTLALWTVAVAWGTVTKLFGALAVAAGRAFAVAVAVDMAIRTGRTATAAMGGFGCANTVHHFLAGCARGSSHHIASRWMA